MSFDNLSQGLRPLPPSPLRSLQVHGNMSFDRLGASHFSTLEDHGSSRKDTLGFLFSLLGQVMALIGSYMALLGYLVGYAQTAMAGNVLLIGSTVCTELSGRSERLS